MEPTLSAYEIRTPDRRTFAVKIALCSTYVPFLHGGYRNIVEWLEASLKEAGHLVERIYLPETDHPDALFQQMAAFRWIDLTAADRIICFRPQSHLIPHPNKILWFIHHKRLFYDLWDSPYRDFPDDEKHRSLREALHRADNAAFREARKIFTNSQVVSDRLMSFNSTPSEVLYPPVFQPERFHCRMYGEEIVCIARVEPHKRQHLLVHALSLTQTPVRLRLCGAGSGNDYPHQLRDLAASLGCSDRVHFENRWIREQEKVEILSDCLAAAYLPFNEDSYGYPSVEAAHARKAVLTTTDAGGVLELVIDRINGLVVEPDPEAIAGAMDRLYQDRAEAARMGQRAGERLRDLDISWDRVLEKILG